MLHEMHVDVDLRRGEADREPQREANHHERGQGEEQQQIPADDAHRREQLVASLRDRDDPREARVAARKLALLTADPMIAEQGTRNVFTGRDLAAAIAFSSPLSLPLVADQLPPMLRTALA